MTINAVIADDEPIMRRNIRRLLRMHPAIHVQAECGDGISVVKAIIKYSPDVVFLDIEMPGANGLQVVSEIGRDKMPLTVFITAHAEYAIQAFEDRAVDYLLKPFGQTRFDETLVRLSERLTSRSALVAPTEQSASAPPPRRAAYLDMIPIHHRGHVYPLKLADVDWMQAEKNHVLLHIGDRIEVVRRTVQSLADALNPRKFIRIHRSTIVNVDKIREIKPWQNGHHLVVLRSGQTLRMSRYQQESASILLDKGFVNPAE
jgi:two-component system LytT family response regulator